ncbi:MAG: hypothetical protein JXB04_03155, partial [Kiritimatiellae bacterium]|nr:hypothetical protein [Kiritimatiellia bacterium]
MKYALAVLTGTLCAATIFGQNAVPVGRGSYAEFPPAHEGDGPAEMTTTRTLYVVSTNERPIPTNDWWTDLLISRYAGDLWAYPHVVSAHERGISICGPRDWNEDGSRILPDTPLEIRGVVKPAPRPADLPIADFEAETYGTRWKITGEAFGRGPAEGALPGQTPLSGHLGRRLVNSFHGGDGSTGSLLSPEFPIQRKYIHFLLAGGNNPGVLGAQLVVRGKSVRAATGDDSEDLKWRMWDVSELVGQNARIELLDNASGGWGHVNADHFFQSDDAGDPARIYTTVFAPADARALAWGDWTVTFRMEQDGRRRMDVTLGHGLPYVWLEFENVSPLLKLAEGAAFFAADGSPVEFPATADHLGLRHAGRAYGLFAPRDTIFRRDGDVLEVVFAGKDSYLVVAVLPAPDALKYFEEHSRAVPRDSRMDWSYDPAAGEVTTRWHLSTKALRAGAGDLVQGWLPHHYRNTRHGLVFNPIEYATPRGRMRCATGGDFEITYRFNGILPNLPAPAPLGLTNDYDAGRMQKYLADYAQKTNYGGDTYWGGKDLLYYAQYMAMAHELGHPAFEVLRERLREALTDWFTYTPGEEAHYFARYPNWKALVGFNESYWSYQFTDQHFHYGYFTTAAGLLGLHDPDFLDGYGEMARLVAREYANWDRDNRDFPFLRTFDPWLGHSWAGGFSSPGGNNQESSSEAMQSWGGLFLLGTALNDRDMVAAGAMGYAMESQAALEYWFNRHGDVFPAAYPRDVVGILFGNGQAYATYFSGDPAWIYGIQWLPISPFLLYLAEDPAFARRKFE